MFQGIPKKKYRELSFVFFDFFFFAVFSKHLILEFCPRELTFLLYNCSQEFQMCRICQVYGVYGVVISRPENSVLQNSISIPTPRIDYRQASQCWGLSEDEKHANYALFFPMQDNFTAKVYLTFDAKTNLSNRVYLQVASGMPDEIIQKAKLRIRSFMCTLEGRMIRRRLMQRKTRENQLKSLQE